MNTDNEYFLYHLSHPGISTSVLQAVLAFGFLATSVVLVFASSDRFRNVLLVWLLACLYMILHIAVFGRESKDACSLQLMPFWSLTHIREGFTETIYEKIYNVLFFVPYGFLLGAYPHPLPKGKGVLSGRTILIGFLTSVGIELLQLITRTGTCETDDVICNTLGCGIGVVIEVGICRMIIKFRNK